MKHPLINNMRY